MMVCLPQSPQRTDAAAGQNDEDGVYAKEKGRCKGSCHHQHRNDIVLLDNAFAQGEDHVCDHRSHTRLHSFQYCVDDDIFPEGHIAKRNQGNNQQWREHRSQNGHDCAQHTSHPVSQQNRGVDCHTSRRRLGNGRHVEHFLFFQPPQFIHKLFLHQRDDDISSAKGEGTQVKGRGKQLPINFLIHFHQQNLLMLPL